MSKLPLAVPLVIISILLSISVIDSKAQGNDSSQKKSMGFYGIKLGWANYSLSGSEVDLRTKGGSVSKSRSGVELGIAARLEFFQLFYLKSELNYLQKGGHLKGGG